VLSHTSYSRGREIIASTIEYVLCDISNESAHCDGIIISRDGTKTARCTSERALLSALRNARRYCVCLFLREGTHSSGEGGGGGRGRRVRIRRRREKSVSAVTRLELGSVSLFLFSPSSVSSVPSCGLSSLFLRLSIYISARLCLDATHPRMQIALRNDLLSRCLRQGQRR